MTALVNLANMDLTPLIGTQDPSGSASITQVQVDKMPSSGLSWPGNLTAQVPGDVGADFGLILRNRPAHIGSGRPLEDLYPVIEIKLGDRWQLSLDDGIKYTAARFGPLSIGPVVEFRQSFSDRLPKGAHKMPDAVEAGGFVVYKTPIGDFESRLRNAVNSYKGWSGDLSFDTGGHITPTTGIGLEIRASWADNNFSNQYFGLKHHSSDLFSLPRFLPNDYTTFGAELTVGHKIDAVTTLFAQTSLDRIYGEEWRSPVLKSRNIFIFSLGVTWHFGQRTPDSL